MNHANTMTGSARLAVLSFLAASVVHAQPAAPPAAEPAALRIHPGAIRLDDSRDRHRVVVVASYTDGTTRDVTAECELVLSPSGTADWTGHYELRAVADGDAELTARFATLEARVPVTSAHSEQSPAVSFANEVIPVLTRAGCNAGSCHGSASGKNGFALSLFGYDKAGDHRRLTRDLRGRRANPADPESSLMLLKPTGGVAHKGGKRIAEDAAAYATLRDWIGGGATNDLNAAPVLQSIELSPRQIVLVGSGAPQRLVVTARYSDGSDRDVTDLALLSSSNEVVATVDERGVVQSAEQGESYVLARFGTCAEVMQVLVLKDDAPWSWPTDVTAFNYIDTAVHDKLRKQRLAPAGVCDDATFLRRAYLDVIGVLPTPEEARRFLGDARPEKRALLVDELLLRPEFPDVWALHWAEVLRIESRRLYGKAVHVYTAYLRDAFRQNRPFDQVVRELLTSEGAGFTNPAANFYVVDRDPKQIAENVAQVFMGVRIMCAQCHNHPFERWTMDDYYGFTAFFTRVSVKAAEDPRDRVVYARGGGDIRHPVTKAIAAPEFLGGEVPDIARGEDRREVLARWLTAPDNPFFAKNVANRVWARFAGRGLVDPTDDVRVSNPPSHPELFDRLGEKLVEYGYDVRQLIRDICASRTYQLAAHPEAPPAATLASAPIRRLTAEQLLDAIDLVTGVPTKHRGLALGARATRSEDGRTGNRFLEVFGRPARESSCTCDRRDEPTLSQVLHLVNGSTTTDKLRDVKGRLKSLLAAETEDEGILDELYLAAYGRHPTAAERAAVLAQIGEPEKRSEAWEDVFWAALNSKEFLFNH